MKESTREALRRAQMKYDNANTKKVFMKLNKTTDADIISRLETVGNVQGYLKALIRQDIEKNEE